MRAGASSDAARQQARVRFAVRDTGIGIAPENQPSIFSGFTQAEASTTRRFGGTGLGLSICQRLVELMGGELQLDSALGQGSTFSFTLRLPAGHQACAIARQRCSRRLHSAPQPARLRALVVDDNPMARELLPAMGESLGWQIETADSGEAALALHRRARTGMASPIDAVFVDWQMPGLDGWQTRPAHPLAAGMARPRPRR